MKNSVLFLFLAILAIFLAAFIVGYRQIFVYKARASIISTGFSAENSYLFVSPLRAAVANNEKIRLSAIILNEQGIGVANKRITLQNDDNLLFEDIQGSTDNHGKAIFDISAKKPGEYYLRVQADGQYLNQTAHLTFY